MITPEQHAEIRRLYFGEHWKVGTIVAHLGVHPDTVRAAIALDARVVRRGACRRSILDPYLPFIRTRWRNIRGCAPPDSTRSARLCGIGEPARDTRFKLVIGPGADPVGEEQVPSQLGFGPVRPL